MKRILTTTAIFIASLITLVSVIVVLRLPNDALEVIAGGILISIILVAVACIWYIKLMAGINLDIKRGESRIVQAKANEADANAKAAKYREYKDGFGMLHLLNLETDIIENLSAFPGTHHNGTWVEPPAAAAAAWHALVGRRGSGSPVELLSSGQAQEYELLDLINRYVHLHIFGRTGNGKTSILRTIGQMRQRQGHKVFVLDSNDHPAEWEGLTRIKDHAEQDEFIAKALTVHRINSEALADGRAIESDFEQCTILSNEWTDIVRRTETAALFIDEMSRKSRKSGFHCAFATQTKLAADLGLDGRYQVIRNFLQLELLVSSSGVHTAKAYADGQFIIELPVPAPPPRAAMLSQGYTPPSMDDIIVEAVATVPGATEKQQAILDTYDSGISDLKYIARIVYGESGGRQVELVQKTLAKFGRT